MYSLKLTYKTMSQKQKTYLSVKEAADILGVSRIAVFQKIKRGQIQAEKIGRNYIIQAKDLPGVHSTAMTKKREGEIRQGVTRVVKEYGETLRLLAKE